MSAERLEYLDDGRIRYTPTDGDVITLRRPKLGELREFRTRIDELVAEAEQHRKDKDTGLDQSADIVGWLIDAFKALGDNPLPSIVDELPPWFEAPELPLKFLVHWRTVPTVPGP